MEKIISNKDRDCILSYETHANRSTDSWYCWARDVLDKYDVIYIESFLFPMTTYPDKAVTFLKEFCDTMTIENKVVVYDDVQLLEYLEQVSSNVYYETCIEMLEHILYFTHFEPVGIYNYSFLNSSIYVYTGSTVGAHVYEELHKIYGV